MPFCTRCGGAVDAADRFCRECGAEVRAGAAVQSPRPSTAVRPTPALPSQPDPARAPVASEDADVRPRGVLLGPIHDPLTLAAPTETSPGRRLIFIIGCFLIIAISGVAGYRWFSRSTPEARSVAVDATEQSIDSPASMTGTPRAGSTSTSGRAATSDTPPRGGEASNVIADFTKETTDAGNALGAPDGRTAVIAPGGSLAVAWADGPFYNDHGPDVRVDGPIGHRLAYVIFARNGPEEPWTRFDINRKGFPDGTAAHDFGHHGLARAQQIMLRNEGTSPLYIDAVTPLHRQAETHEEDKSSGRGRAR